MAIKILFTKSFGQVIADVEETVEQTSYVLKNPCVIQVAQNQLGLIPLLGTVEEDKLTLPLEEAFGGLYTPEASIYNHYNSQFGSGIVLETSPIIK